MTIILLKGVYICCIASYISLNVLRNLSNRQGVSVSVNGRTLNIQVVTSI